MVEICLSILLIFTNIYWAVVCNRLTNKLMSRNYAEFVQIERLRKLPTASTKPHVALIDPIAEDNAEKANRLFT